MGSTRYNDTHDQPYDTVVLAATSADDMLPRHKILPAVGARVGSGIRSRCCLHVCVGRNALSLPHCQDLFTSCLTTPIKIALWWHMLQNPTSDNMRLTNHLLRPQGTPVDASHRMTDAPPLCNLKSSQDLTLMSDHTSTPPLAVIRTATATHSNHTCAYECDATMTCDGD